MLKSLIVTTAIVATTAANNTCCEPQQYKCCTADSDCCTDWGQLQCSVGVCVFPGTKQKQSFTSAATAYKKVAAPMVKYSFTFTGDGDNNQAPTHGCFEQDNGCQMCIQAWWNYPPDASYKYEPIVSKGCPANTTIRECDFCPPGLTFYQ